MEFNLTLPAWFLVARSGAQIDPESGAVTLSPDFTVAAFGVAAGLAVPVFSTREAAERFARHHSIEAEIIPLAEPAVLLDFLERYVPADTAVLSFDPSPESGGVEVTRAEAIRVVRGE